MINFPGQSSQPSVMRHDFGATPKADIQRSGFDRSHGYKTTFDAGYLIPFFWDYCVPGDTHSVNASVLARLATPKFPIMDNMMLSTFFFSVPFRLILDTAAQLLGQIDSPEADPYDVPPPNTHVVPQIESDGSNNGLGSLADYFGIPVNDGASNPVIGLRYSAFRFRAYNLIWNEWFRDQNQQQPLQVLKDEADDTTPFAVQRRTKRFDYFTGGLPWPQKSAPVTISVTGSAPVVFPTVVQGGEIAGSTSSNPVVYLRGGAGGGINHLTDGGGGDVAAPEAVKIRMDSITDAYADTTALTALSLTQFFQAYALQQLYQADARGGTRLTEIIFHHFGVSSPDMRLQRPEYLGGGKTPVNVSPIPNTSDTGTGLLGAMGLISGSGHGFSYSATEHCVIIGLMCVDADLTYQQGLEREESVRSRFDFYWPSLSNLGEQAVLSKELYADGSGGDDDVFSYMPAWDHLRYKKSNITGLFRSNVTGSLDSWHLAQDFASRPTLGNDFIESDPPVDRVIQVSSEPHFLFDSYFRVNSVRPMPTYSVPGIFNHF